MLNTLNGLFIAAVLAGTPLLLGALGEILTEKSGNLNLGVEGMMFMGAITGLAGSYYYEQAVISAGGNPNGVLSAAIALLTSFLAGAGGALIYSFLTITLRANQNVTGLTLTIFGTGFGNFFGEYIGQKAGGYVAVSETTKKAFSGLHIPGLSDIPVIGPLLFEYNWLVYFAIIVAVVMAWFFNRSRVGLNPARGRRGSGDRGRRRDQYHALQVPGNGRRRRYLRDRRYVHEHGDHLRRVGTRLCQRLRMARSGACYLRDMEPGKGNDRSADLRRADDHAHVCQYPRAAGADL